MSSQQILIGIDGKSAAERGTLQSRLYVDELFYPYLHDGNSSNKTVKTNVDMLDSGDDDIVKGSMVWLKKRYTSGNHQIFDTVRGTGKAISSNTTSGETTDTTTLTAFKNNGFSLGSSSDINEVEHTYISWSFVRASKFFDIVEWEGDDSGSRVLTHKLNSVPGCILIKRTDGDHHWYVYHRGSTSSDPHKKYLKLDSTDDAADKSSNEVTSDFMAAAPTASNFTLAANIGTATDNDYDGLNTSGQSYVAYLFAHDEQVFGLEKDQSIIKCGSFTTDSSGNATIDVGWEPSFVLMKGEGGDWLMFDTLRDFPVEGRTHKITANGLDASYNSSNWIWEEVSLAGSFGPNWSSSYSGPFYKLISSTGFSVSDGNANSRHIYICIRRPDGYVGSPVTDPRKLFNVITGVSNTSTDYDNLRKRKDVFPNFPSKFPVDFALERNQRDGYYFRVLTRIMGDTLRRRYLRTDEPSSGNYPGGHTYWRHWYDSQGWYHQMPELLESLGIASNQGAGFYGQRHRMDSNEGFGRSQSGRSASSKSKGNYTGNFAWMWARHGKAFDCVTYDGTYDYDTAGSYNQTTPRFIPHSLNKQPEMIVIKRTDGPGNGSWLVWHKDQHFNDVDGYSSYDWYSMFDSTNLIRGVIGDETRYKVFDSGTNTSQFGVYNQANRLGWKYIAYLFTGIKNVSCIGKYNGSGTVAPNISFPSESGSFRPKFMMIKKIRTLDSKANSEWHVLDDQRGLSTAAYGIDPRLELGTKDLDTGFNVITFKSNGFQLRATGYGAYLLNAADSQYIYYAHG